MIGILANESEVRVVQEFFQLFKTPWEFYIPGGSYEVVISTLGTIPMRTDARVLIIYNSRVVELDEHMGVVEESTRTCDWVEWEGNTWPIYGHVATFKSAGKPFLRHHESGETVGTKIIQLGGPIIRIGLDLFSEVAFLLSQGQPSENGHIPTLDMHISLLRAIMVNAGVPFVEVPPVPAGYEFMACLTHDVDFVGIRDHKCDHTMWGFLYRCFVGSVVNALKGRLTWSKCVHNLTAGLSLPLVHLGFRGDFWLEFDRYMQIERELGSTFFFIPFKDVAGTSDSGQAPKRRAAKYDLARIREQVMDLVNNNCEVGLHGIDAWRDSRKAYAELRQIQEVTGILRVGTRIHWLYWSQTSPKVLEEAGLAYDSTFGYNDAVGFRPGTSQVFRPVGAQKLLELTLNIQDTALFYPDRMNLSETRALESCKSLIQHLVSFGGALTINWHTRSLSPDRLWEDFYTKLLSELKRYRVWFATAGNAVDWFRRRRALNFDTVEFTSNYVRVECSGSDSDGGPPFLVRIHHPRFQSHASEDNGFPMAYRDAQWNGETLLVAFDKSFLPSDNQVQHV